jgi:hypothetical protein
MRVECALYERCMLPVARCMLHLVEPHDPCRQCSAVQYSAVQCTALHRTALQCTAPQCTTLQSSALQFVTLVQHAIHARHVRMRCNTAAAAGYDTRSREQ